MAKFSLNANTVEPGQPRYFSPIPPGPQTVQIINSEIRAIKAKPGQDPDADNGSYLWLEIEVVDGEYERRKLFENLVLNHPNPQTVQIAQQTLREICLACNKPNIEDSEELHNVPFVVDLVVEQDRRNRTLPAGQPPYPPVNRIKAYRPVDAGFVAPVPRAAANGSNGAGHGQGAFTAGMDNGSRMPAAAAAANGAGGGGGGLPWGPRNK